MTDAPRTLAELEDELAEAWSAAFETRELLKRYMLALDAAGVDPIVIVEATMGDCEHCEPDMAELREAWADAVCDVGETAVVPSGEAN